MRSRGRWRRASTSLSLLADGMTYYSCHDFYKAGPSCPKIISGQVQDLPLRVWTQGDSNPDLLNAIETRSQLRYGPGFQ